MRVVAAATAQDSAGGAVVTAASGAAEILIETAVQPEIVTGELRGDSSNILADSTCCRCEW